MNIFYGSAIDFRPSPKQKLEYHKIDTQPNYRYFTQEERIIAKEIIGVSIQDYWQPQYPFDWNGINKEHYQRRLYTKTFRPCPICKEKASPWIDRFKLIAGTHCSKCKADVPIGSYLEYELNRKTKNAIVSDYQGYIENDPSILDLPLWAESTMTHLGAAMGTGKTTLVFNKTYESDENAVTIILVPRKSLALGIWNEQIRRLGSSYGWGLFYSGSNKRYRKIGRYGAIGTIPSLATILSEIQNEGKEGQPVYIFIDEIDFSTRLINAEILKTVSIEVKDLLKRIIEKNGIVVAGQTEMTATLESAAAELDINPDVNLHSYYNKAIPVESVAEIRLYPQKEGMKNEAVAGIRESITEDIQRKTNVYALCDGRRVAQMIQELQKKAILYDRYTRSDPRNQDLLYVGHLGDAKLFSSSNAVDVGISLHDENAITHVCMIENTRTYGDIASTVQQGLRNRAKKNVILHYVKYNNALPLAPSSTIEHSMNYEKQKIDEDDIIILPQHLIEWRAKRLALETLAEDQPETFIAKHWGLAGYTTRLCMATQPDFVETQKVKDIRKELRQDEKEQTIKISHDILENKEVMTDSEIRRAGEQGKLDPIPFNQIAHEMANEALRAVGWDGQLVRTTEDKIKLSLSMIFYDVFDEQWEASHLYIDDNLGNVDMNSIRNGYIGVHYNEITHEQLRIEKEKCETDITHIQDDRKRAELLSELLNAMPQELLHYEDVAKLVIHVFQKRYGHDRFSALIKEGSLGLTWATQTRFINLGVDAVPEMSHVEIANKFIRRYYPAQMAKQKNKYMLVKSSNVESVVKVIECNIRNSYDEIPAKENEHLIPIHEKLQDGSEETIADAQKLRNEGMPLKEIAAMVEKSVSWVSRNTLNEVIENIKRVIDTIKMAEMGYNITEISEKTGKDRKTIRRWLKE